MSRKDETLNSYRNESSSDAESSSSSSSSSPSESSTDKKGSKKRKRDSSNRNRKEKKNKKEKKHKKDKHKKHKKEKKSTRKKDKAEKKVKGDLIISNEVSFEEAHDIAEFKKAVQGKQTSLSNVDQSSLVHASATDIALTLGLPKGLIRTSEQTYSITERVSNSLFGESEDNPAKRQRMRREMIAQKAIETARKTITANRAAAESGKSNNSAGNSVADMFSRFQSSGRSSF